MARSLHSLCLSLPLTLLLSSFNIASGIVFSASLMSVKTPAPAMLCCPCSFIHVCVCKKSTSVAQGRLYHAVPGVHARDAHGL
ncbi:hypothetical protein EV126DRAFT_405369 [Verticillium dahliae]|nr:hypothetical protein EV126DRAFT_405369 [Verticillium dahliae]